MSLRDLTLWTLVAILLTRAAIGQEAIPPREVKVLPIFFVPSDEPAPTEDQTKRLMRHLLWCQTRYRELLQNESTFAIAGEEPFVYQSERELAFYKRQPEGSAPQFASELLTEFKATRYNCPYIFLVVLMNSKDSFPVGGGRPLNGGFNTGGGIVIVSSFTLARAPNFQSTLQHEIGHSFGLPHVDVYGYDMKSNNSVMSYNPAHHTNGFVPSKTPGELIPEDLRGLAINQRVFAKLRFDPKKDMSPKYSLATTIVTLGPMKIPGQPDGLKVTTISGEINGSKVANIVQGWIHPNKSAGKNVTYVASTMWHSAKSPTGRVRVQVEFPYEVELTGIVVHSQHSGKHHVAKAVGIYVRDTTGKFLEVTKARLPSADATVKLEKPTKGNIWGFEFMAGQSGTVVIRGLRFFSGDDELFPPLAFQNVP